MPLYHYYLENEDHYYTINQGIYGDYIYQGGLCYVYPNQVPKSLPVYSHFSTTSGIHHYKSTLSLIAGWNFEDAVFYLLHNKQKSMHPLPDDEYAEWYCYYHNNIMDHYTK